MGRVGGEVCGGWEGPAGKCVVGRTGEWGGAGEERGGGARWGLQGGMGRGGGRRGTEQGRLGRRGEAGRIGRGRQWQLAVARQSEAVVAAIGGCTTVGGRMIAGGSFGEDEGGAARRGERIGGKK